MLYFVFLITQIDTFNININENILIRGEIKGRVVSRIIFKFEIPQILYNSKIYYAQLSFSNFLDTNNKRAEIEAFRITTPWKVNTVNWFYPWRNPGAILIATVMQLT